MRYVGTILASILALSIVGAVAIFSFLPHEETSTGISKAEETVEFTAAEQAPAPITIDPTQIEAGLAERKLSYQGQINQLDQALQERQATYQNQIELLSTQVASAQNKLDELQAREEGLKSQVAELGATRTERVSGYQSQLEQVQAQYNARFAEIEQAITEAQTKLAEANAQLGR